jgi:hypothetical protein
VVTTRRYEFDLIKVGAWTTIWIADPTDHPDSRKATIRRIRSAAQSYADRRGLWLETQSGPQRSALQIRFRPKAGTA